jgi:oligoribonuclease NrnB/cAMP/cGMP phosphodiesterase (DHH superfamily)
MIYDLYFHNDFDGCAAAAVMLSFLRSRGDDVRHYVPLKYDIMPQWTDERFFEKHRLFCGKRHPAIVLDFPYHPQAAFWFDHHLKPFRKDGWEKRFKPTLQRRYDESYASACHFVYDSLRRGFGWKPPAYLAELAKWLDVIDGANYRSAKQTIEMREPAIQINNFIEEKADNLKMTVWAIRYLSEKPLTDFVKEPLVARIVKKLRRNTMAALDFYKRNIAVIGNVMIADLSGFRFAELGHYVPYCLHPRLLYAVRYYPSSKHGPLFHVNVSANPWRRSENKKHIGKLLKRYGGGGHKGVGGVEFEGRKKTLRAVNDLVKFLNKK